MRVKIGIIFFYISYIEVYYFFWEVWMQNPNLFLRMLYNNEPNLRAEIRGNSANSNIFGLVNIFILPMRGVLFEVEISGLPNENLDEPSFLGMHIHENGDCSDDFANTGSHYNPGNKPHPHHKGDLPPIMNNNGYSYMLFYDEFLSIADIRGRSVIIHSDRDDFTTQPSGDSGTKIACGVFEDVIY